MATYSINGQHVSKYKYTYSSFVGDCHLFDELQEHQAARYYYISTIGIMLLDGLTGHDGQHSSLSLFTAAFLLIATCAAQSPVRSNGNSAANVWKKHGNYVAFQASTLIRIKFRCFKAYY